MADIIQALEQLETMVVNQANVVASYYKQLIEDNIPLELATALTIRFADIMWESAFKNNSESS